MNLVKRCFFITVFILLGILYAQEQEVNSSKLTPGLTITNTYPDSGDTIKPTAEVVSPNGGEVFDQDENTHMIFSASDNVGVVSRKVEYTSDSGATWSLLDSATWSPAYTWDIPEIASTQCKIKVTAYDSSGNFGSDESDTTFIINGPTVEFMSPNGGEVFDQGDTTEILYSPGADPKVKSRKIEYTSNWGATWTIIDSSAHYTGAYTWIIPNYVSTGCKVKVTVYDDSHNQASDESDTTFTIIEPIAITAPDLKVLNFKINAFNKTGLQLSTPVEFFADVMVYSINGALLKKIKGRQFKVGINQVVFKKNLSNGVYLLEICGKDVTVSHRFILTK